MEGAGGPDGSEGALRPRRDVPSGTVHRGLTVLPAQVQAGHDARMAEPGPVQPVVDPALLWDAVARWSAMVRLRREQFERLCVDRPDPRDYWQRRALNYFEAIRTRHDPGEFVRTVVAACQDAESHGARWATGAEPPPATVLDVGGGFGAVAVPVAGRGRRVTVVEPHPSMVQLLERWATQERVADRIRVVQQPWPPAAAEIEPHDVVVCSHVLYPIEDVVPFIDALIAATRRACLITMRLGGPEQAPGALFRDLHGEERVPQPGFGDLCALLAGRGLHFDATTYETDATWSYADLDEAEAVLAESLLVTTRPDARTRVRAWAEATLVPEAGRLVAPHRRVLAGIATLRPGAVHRPGARSPVSDADGWQSF